MNHWLRYHKEVLEEERREAALDARSRKPEPPPKEAVSRPARPDVSRPRH